MGAKEWKYNLSSLVCIIRVRLIRSLVWGVALHRMSNACAGHRGRLKVVRDLSPVGKKRRTAKINIRD